MSYQDIIRAWKDEEFRAGLTEAQLAALPVHPAGLIELDDDALDAAAGGWFCPSNSCGGIGNSY